MKAMEHTVKPYSRTTAVSLAVRPLFGEVGRGGVFLCRLSHDLRFQPWLMWMLREGRREREGKGKGEGGREKKQTKIRCRWACIRSTVARNARWGKVQASIRVV